MKGKRTKQKDKLFKWPTNNRRTPSIDLSVDQQNKPNSTGFKYMRYRNKKRVTTAIQCISLKLILPSSI